MGLFADGEGYVELAEPSWGIANRAWTWPRRSITRLGSRLAGVRPEPGSHLTARLNLQTRRRSQRCCQEGSMKVGIDFGTTNSAIAVTDAAGKPQILEIVPGERTQRTVIHADLEGNISFGNAAFRNYLEADLRGRFLRSLKAFLPHDVPPTTIGRTTITFVDLVARYLVYLVEAAERITGRPIDDVVVGRPVRFHADDDKHDRALENLEEAIRISGLPAPVMQLEPIAAALRYERGLHTDHIVLVGDFGGGTSDFAILRVGPGQQGRLEERVLGTSGVALAGNALDGRFLDAFVLDFLGRGTTFVPRGKRTPQPWEPLLFRQIAKLYDLHRLRDPRLLTYLDDLETRADDPVPIERMRRLVFDDLGYPMATAIETTKRQFSEGPRATFVFDAYFSDRLNIHAEVEHDAFAHASAQILGSFQASLDEVLAQAGLGAADIDEVFLTGGTSQLPFIQHLFNERFGAERVRGGEAFTTVCEGLAVS